jgi:hypothetical protein
MVAIGEAHEAAQRDGLLQLPAAKTKNPQILLESKDPPAL